MSNLQSRNTMVVGGYNDENGQFQALRSEVVPSNRVGTLFLRDYRFLSQHSPVVKVSNTQQKTTVDWA